VLILISYLVDRLAFLFLPVTTTTSHSYLVPLKAKQEGRGTSAELLRGMATAAAPDDSTVRYVRERREMALLPADGRRI